MKHLLIAASALALLASALPASAQSVTIGAPVIACDTPNGVGCNGRNVLRAGKYRVDHVVPYTGICHVTGSNGGGYTRCSAFATKPRGNW